MGALDAANAGLREELGRLSGQLAQRTVLYAAQERRWKEESKVRRCDASPCKALQSSYPPPLPVGQVHEQSQSSLQSSLQTTRARLRQLQEMFDKCQADKLEACLSLQQHASAEEQLRSELRESQLSLFRVEEDLAASRSQLSTLQAVVDLLRGSDVSDLETQMVREMDMQVLPPSALLWRLLVTPRTPCFQRSLGRQREEELEAKLSAAMNRLGAAEAARCHLQQSLEAQQEADTGQGDGCWTDPSEASCSHSDGGWQEAASRCVAPHCSNAAPRK